MIVHDIDMMKINQPEYSKVYEAKMLKLIPEWEKYVDDPFGRNLLVKKTKKFKDFKVTRTYMIFYQPKSASSFQEKKLPVWKLDKIYTEITK